MEIPLPADNTPRRFHHRATVEDITDEQDSETVFPDSPEKVINNDDDDEGEDDTRSDQEGEGSAQDDEKDTQWMPPTVGAAREAHQKIKTILQPPRKTGKGYKDPNLHLLLRSQLEAMMQFLHVYTNPSSKVCGKWTAASLKTA
ncbi:hypothetical protein CPB84DRAFT_1849698 [Gymnopilus junonius]|uniref:Uncharacterized protein n=1 Tax=Gymnopilus junonius TaxID=109634 RepID=A0A9P5NFU4_GYMJU|nr:hypothetical protein CPB84DRAFT_1849698 [Gymnopilus junonius]